MITKRGVPAASQKGPSVLVVDDDRRVRELLEIALTAHGFGVLTASDGDEAIRRALAQRPDLIVLDVRLPKKSGLEVCDALRSNPEDPSVPIILVSAAMETDARLQAFARGADDYLSKPFSPKELIARIKRHLVRHGEARTARDKVQELERDLARAQEDARRARAVSHREQALRELASGTGRDLLRTQDSDLLAARILSAVQARLGILAAALLAPEGATGALIPVALRGAGPERTAGLAIRADGELARVLAGLDRPMLREDLERFPELAAELAPFIARRFSLFVPLRGSQGLVAVIVTDERPDGFAPARDELEILAGLCEAAAVAMENCLRFRGQIDGFLDLVAEDALGSGSAALVDEAAGLVSRAAQSCLLAPRESELVRRGVTLNGWAFTSNGRRALQRLKAVDATGRIGALATMLHRSGDAAPAHPETAPDQRRADLLLRAGQLYLESRSSGLAVDDAVAAAIGGLGERLDAMTRQALVNAAELARP